MFQSPLVSESEIDAVQRVHAAFTAERGRIQADPRFTAAAKAAEVAKLRDASNERIAKLEAKFLERTGTERSQLEGRLFTAPGSGPHATPSEKIAAVASFRDAIDRAAQTKDPAELGALLQRAVRSGDRPLARAALVEAFDRGDTRTIETYMQAFERESEDVDRLHTLRANAPGSGAEAGLRRLFSFPPVS